MSEQIREQVSAFLDGELPGAETELLLKRLTRDGELRDSFGRYALIGEAMRGAESSWLKKGFESRVNMAIDGELLPAPIPAAPLPAARWWRPFAGAAVVAGVAAVAIVAMQQRTLEAPQVSGIAALPAASAALASNHEAISYTVPEAPAETPAARASGRLTNYMFAHSRYSYGLGQRGVLTDLLIEDEEQPGMPRQTAQPVPVPVAQ
jgi:negative regulator of sigma E activity